MSLVVYTRNSIPFLQRELERIARDEEIEVYSTIPRFVRRLQKKHYDISSVVLCFEDKEQLKRLSRRTELFQGLRIFAALSGSAESTSNGLLHSLSPRYVSWQAPGHEDLISVLEKFYSGRGSSPVGGLD